MISGAVSLQRVHFFFAKKRNRTKEKFALPLPKDPYAIHYNLANSSGVNTRGIVAP
ncbi:MAG: hypothetical protein OFPII_44320 [Osedax symbiont Rs1]|nr:MAG: hypothetical protein OFPII_44320 [Osedax symbiont Rs1]